MKFVSTVYKCFVDVWIVCLSLSYKCIGQCAIVKFYPEYV